MNFFIDLLNFQRNQVYIITNFYQLLNCGNFCLYCGFNLIKFINKSFCCFFCLFGNQSLNSFPCLMILHCHLFNNIFQVYFEEGYLDWIWHCFKERSLFLIITLNLCFELKNIFWIFFIFFIHLFNNLFWLHLENIKKLIEFIQVIEKRLDSFF